MLVIIKNVCDYFATWQLIVKNIGDLTNFIGSCHVATASERS